MIINRA